MFLINDRYRTFLRSKICKRQSLAMHGALNATGGRSTPRKVALTCNVIFSVRLRPWSNVLFNVTMHLISAEGRSARLLDELHNCDCKYTCQGIASLSRNDNIFTHLNPISAIRHDILRTDNSSLRSVACLPPFLFVNNFNFTEIKSYFSIKNHR